MEDRKIYILEDDANILYGLQAKLSLANFEIHTNSGNTSVEEIINEIQKIKPSFVILDLLLPKVDGFEIAKRIKEDETTKDIIIFIFTSLSDSESKEKGLSVGADYYFLKNELSPDDLVNKIIKILENKAKIN